MPFPWGAAAILGGSALQAITGKSQQEANLRAQEEFARFGIRWRVEDAKQAGVHPLFALGAQTTPFTPGPVVPYDFGLKDIGQNMAAEEQAARSHARSSSMTTEQRALHMAELDGIAAKAQADRAQAGYYDSLSAQARTQVQAASPFPETYTSGLAYKNAQIQGVIPEDKQQVFDPLSDAIVRSYNPGMSGGEPVLLDPRSGGVDNPGRPQPLWSEFDSGRGLIDLPYTPKGQGVMEALEGLDLKFIPFVIQHNRYRFGEGAAQTIMNMLDIAQPGWRSKIPSGGGGYTPPPFP